MWIADLVKDISYTVVQGSMDKEIKDIVQDSRKAEKGDIFVCILGTDQDGHSFAQEAVNLGAEVVMTEQELSLPPHVTVLKTEDTREALALMSCTFFGYPGEQLRTIAITGTKGKTTTCYMIKAILEKAGIKTGLIGTIEILTGEEQIDTVNTTPEAYLLQKYLRKMVESGCEAVVMEASSQGFKLKRMAGMLFDYGAFLNISSDHIGAGEHSTFEEYLQCKSMLFRQCKVGVVNMDDGHLSEILSGHTCKVETFSMGKEGDIRAGNIEYYRRTEGLGVKFQVNGAINFPVKLNMPGEFNIYNALCAMGIVKHFKVKIKDITAALEGVTVKGRLEFFNTRQGYHILIDYAHNAASLEQLLTTLRAYNPSRLICLFGCGGNRSKYRRYEMGKVSAKFADFTVVTSDNPRYEVPETIVEDIVKSVSETKGDYITIVDRREAIRYCIENSREGDILVLAGKGHETYQEIEGRRYKMDEREILQEILYK